MDPTSQIYTDKPVIAILTCEFDILNTGEQIESVPSTYTNMLESAGARTVLVSFKWPKEKIYETLDKVNGVLFTGGDILQYNPETRELHPYYLAARDVILYVLKKNNEGDYFPLFGICQGFQSLMIAISGNNDLLSKSIRWGNTDPFSPFIPAFGNTPIMSQLDFSYFSDRSVGIKSEIEFNWHQFGVYLTDFSNSFPLSSFFNVLSYDDYSDGVPIVATVEAYDYPIIATQYHPEKNLFDYCNPNIPHHRRAQQFTEDLSFLFVNECKKNRHQFGSYGEEVNSHVNNYRRHFGLFEHDGDNVYIDYYVFEDKLLSQ